MTLTRRAVCSILPAGLLAGCAVGHAQTSTSILRALADGAPGDRVPASGFIILNAEGAPIAAQAYGWASGLSDGETRDGIPRRDFGVTTPFRAASISKLVVAMSTAHLARAGTVDLDGDLRTWMPDFPRHPDFPDTVITLRMVLSHTSSLQDPDIYWVAHPGSIYDIIQPDLYRPETRPGSRFEYCNFGYGIAATALEAATGQRFDQIARELVLAPAVLDAGFNWSGVSASKRASGATLYTEGSEGWEVQTDGPDRLTASAPAILIDEGADLSTYTPGQNGTLFSPQGGLRASLLDLARIAHMLPAYPDLVTPVWMLNPTADNGDHDQRYFTAFGTGVQTHTADESIWPGQRLIGHHGEAYGLYAGAWHAPELGISFAYAVTGTPETPPARSTDHPALNRFTAPLMQAVRAAYASRSPANR